MDSPESTNSVAPAAAASSSPTVVQESPFYTYVSNLSPIKLVNDARVPSAFRELNFPSPSPVFTSPCINQICKENSLRRSQYLSSDSGKLSLGYPGGTKELPENSSDHGPDASRSMGVLVPCIMDSKHEFPAQVQSCCSPSGCVDDFFADPIEDCANSSGPSDLCSDQANELCQPSQDRYRNPGKTPKECVQSQSCSPSGSVSKLLANQVEYGKTTDSIDVFPDYYPSQAVEIHNNSTKEIIMTLDPHEGNIKDGGVKVAEPSTSACQAEESPTVYEPSMHLICDQSKDSVGVADNVYRSDERQFNQHTGLASQHAMMGDPAEVPASDFHGYKHSVDQTANGTISILPSSGKGDSLKHRGEKSTNPIYCSRNAKTHLAENGQGAEQDSTSQLQLESLHIVQPDISHQDNFRAVCNTSVENVFSYEQGCLPSKLQLEGSQHTRAMRKRLEFVSSGTSKMNLECGGRSWNLGTTTDRGMSTSIESPSSPSDLETLNASLAESIETSEDMQVSHSANFSAGALSNLSLCLHQTMEAQMDSVDISIRENGSSSVTVPRRAGIGLHLNSLQNAAVNCNENMQLVEKDLGNDCLRVQGEMALPKSDDQRMNDSKGCITSMTLTCSVSVKSAVDSYSPLVCSSVERSEQNQQRNPASLVPNSSVSLPSPVNVNPFESSLQSKFCSHSIAPCNMKRIHTEGPCRFGEQSVMSPKKKSKKASENDGCKRCNCKKSKCLKLYCDCFAAGDYCAEACACQACLNRPEYEDTVLETRQQIENRNPLAFAPKVIVHFAEGPKASGEDNKHATPASARHKIGCNCKRSQCLKKYCECFQSKVGCSLGCRCEGCKNSYGTKNGGVEIVETEHRKTKNEKCENYPCDRIAAVEVRSEMSNYYKRLHLSPFTPSLEGSHGINASKSQFPARRYLSSPESAASALSPFSSHKSGINNIFQAREGNLALVPYHKELDVHDEFELGTYSPRWDRFPDICNLSPLSNSSPSDPREQTRVLFHGSSRLSVHSLLWHGSPNTPTPQFGESKLALESCSDSGALNNYEDDTPDILKYTHMPDKGPKMSSPNKKRVSPPHKYPNEMISGSSPSLRGRKFILRAVPSFPSLTPYSNNIKRHGT